MPETTQIKFPFKELTAILIKAQDIHEGYWSVYAKFGINAINLSVNGAPAVPSAIVPLLEIGLTRESDTEAGELAVNAAEVNPAPTGAKKAGTKKATKKAGTKKQQR